MKFQLNMEALRAEPVPEGETPPSSVQLVSKVLTQTSSNQFLKSVGMKPPTSSKSSSANESELREQLAAEAAAAVQGELDELKKKSQEAEEKLARTQIELEEYKKLTERNTKEMEETNLILKKLLSLHSNASSI
jgi:molecular chaperone GrpE (heat shock protein)